MTELEAMFVFGCMMVSMVGIVAVAMIAKNKLGG